MFVLNQVALKTLQSNYTRNGNETETTYTLHLQGKCLLSVLYWTCIQSCIQNVVLSWSVDLVNRYIYSCLYCTFARLGPLRQEVKGSKGKSEACRLHGWRLLRASPQVAPDLRDALQSGAVLVLHPNQGDQEGHERPEEDTQQRAPSSDDTSAGITPHRHSRHDDSRSNCPSSSSDTVPHMHTQPS